MHGTRLHHRHRRQLPTIMEGITSDNTNNNPFLLRKQYLLLILAVAAAILCFNGYQQSLFSSFNEDVKSIVRRNNNIHNNNNDMLNTRRKLSSSEINEVEKFRGWVEDRANNFSSEQKRRVSYIIICECCCRLFGWCVCAVMHSYD